MVDLGSLVILTSIFGANAAAVYVILGLVIALAGGTLIEKMHMERHIEGFVLEAAAGAAGAGIDIRDPELTQRERLIYAKTQMLSTFKKVFPYILLVWAQCGHTQLSARGDYKQSLRQRQRIRRHHRHRGRCADVCRHFRHHPYCRGPALQGRTARYGACADDKRQSGVRRPPAEPCRNHCSSQIADKLYVSAAFSCRFLAQVNTACKFFSPLHKNFTLVVYNSIFA